MLIKTTGGSGPYEKLQERQVARMRQVAKRSMSKTADVGRQGGVADGEGGLTSSETWVVIHRTVGRAERLKEPIEVLREGRVVRHAGWRILLPVDIQVLPGDRVTCGVSICVTGSSVRKTGDVFEEPAESNTAATVQEVYGYEYGDIPNQ